MSELARRIAYLKRELEKVVGVPMARRAKFTAELRRLEVSRDLIDADLGPESEQRVREEVAAEDSEMPPPYLTDDDEPNHIEAALAREERERVAADVRRQAEANEVTP